MSRIADALAARIAAVEALHQPVTYRVYEARGMVMHERHVEPRCSSCTTDIWPCPTRKALEGES